MRDLLTLDRIQVETAEEHGPFVVVGAPQADQMRSLLDAGGVSYQLLKHDFTEDVMFEFEPDINTIEIQTLLDASD